MITNKDISIDSENGKITLNGNKYDLGTQGEIDTAVKGVYSVMGQNGAKNLIPYPYKETTKKDHDVTFTVENDGTVIANGKANGTAQLYLVLGNVSLSDPGNLVINTNKPLFLSGCPSGGGNNTFRIQYGLTDGTNYWAKTASDTGSGVEITPVDGLNSYSFVVIKIMVFDGYTASNLTFKPMLRLASDTDNTYEPYAMTNKQLTEQVADINTELDSIHPTTDKLTSDVFESNSAVDIAMVFNETGNDDYKGLCVNDKDGNERYRLYFTGGHIKFLSKAADGTTIVDTTLA